MAKLDRLGWAAGVAFRCHGARIGIRANDPTVVDRLVELLPPGSTRVSSAVVDSLYSLVAGGDGATSQLRRFHLLYAGAERLARTMEFQEALDTLELALHASVVVGASRRLFVRAGVVAWRGRAIVILGPSRGGTSTLVAALVGAGATYYSDRFAVFDASGRVHPYAAPLWLWGEDGHGPTKRRPEELGGRTGCRPVPVGLTVTTTYEPGARWHPRRLSPAQAVLALLQHTVLARVRPEFALRTLKSVVSSAGALDGARGENADVVQPLMKELAPSVA